MLPRKRDRSTAVDVYKQELMKRVKTAANLSADICQKRPIQVDGIIDITNDDYLSNAESPSKPILQSDVQKPRIVDSQLIDSSQILESTLANESTSKKKPKTSLVTRNVHQVAVDQYFDRPFPVHVFELNTCFYSMTLSQSNIATDNNKFYIIQILRSQVHVDEFYVLIRWGRVGVVGQITVNGPLTRSQAIKIYNTRLRDKIKIGGYKVVEIGENTPESSIDVDNYLNCTVGFEESKLPFKIQDLLRLIFNFQMMNTQMKEIGYDDKRSPLGLLAKSNIDRGYLALQRILSVLKNDYTGNVCVVRSEAEKRKELNEASSEFYSAIPHDFGYMNLKAFILDTKDKVQPKLEMLASLNEIQICSKLMNDRSKGDGLNDIDRKYLKLNCQIEVLPKGTKIYESLMKYVENTHGKTHDKYTLQVVNIFTVKRHDEDQQFRKQLSNRYLLWHGSRLTNFVGILSQGLKIAPYEAPVTGYMFGKGIYFADMVSKSANYCLSSRTNPIGLMLLCEVALGGMNDLFTADYNAQALPQGKHSTRGVGKYSPTSGEFVQGMWIPNQRVQKNELQQVCMKVLQVSLMYNEYVVYRKEQIRFRFLVQLRFHYKDTNQ